MADTIPARVFARAKERPADPAYYVKTGGSWKPTSWRGYAEEVRTAGKALIALGFEPDDKVVILGFNRPEWSIMDLAAMAVGGAPAGIYTTCSPPEVQYITDHTEAKVALAENHSQWEKFKAEKERLPHLKHVVLMKGSDPVDDEMVLTWDEFMKKGQEGDDDEFQRRLDALELQDLATMIYTSGTTGPPKGVMLSHENLTWTATTAVGLVDANRQDRSISYLPLSHIAEQMFTLHVPATTGAAVFYAESIDKLKDNLLEVKPTIFFGVPRIWEKFYAAFLAAGAQNTGLKKKISAWARKVGTAANDLKNQGKKPSGLLALQYKLASKLVFSKVRSVVGMDELRIAVSGAAPISPEILRFFASLDIVIREVYGQSEDCGPTSFNVPGKTKLGSVGPPIPGTEVKIAEDEEIVVKGPHVFLGYYKEQAATDETLKDGYLCSGDLGRIDEQGFLHITGRKKDIIITAGGKNITPKNIESSIKNIPMVGEAVVVGDKRKYLIALVSLDADEIDNYAQKHGIKREEVFTHPPLHKSIDEGIEKLNQELARVEQVKKFAILPRPLSMEEDELTPTLKVKRAKVYKKWADLIDEVYAEETEAAA